VADRLRSLDEEIARHLEEAAKSGELKAAKGYGQPLPDTPGWDETPEALRMSMKVLKDAGVVPAEVEWLHERARLKTAIEAATDPGEREALQKQLVSLEQKIALRLEALRISARL
jgi:DnaJ-like protein